MTHLATGRSRARNAAASVLVSIKLCFVEDGVAGGDGGARRHLRRGAVALPHPEQVRDKF